MSNYRVSADIGGTFTDIVVSEVETSTTRTGKVLTTPANPAEGVMQGVTEMIGDAAAMDFFVHGTTVGLNAFLERKGKRVLLIMNEGLRDAYTIARGDRKTLYELQYSKPELLVPRRDVHGVRGRLRWDGSEMVPLNQDDFEPIIEKVKAENIESIAICFVHAFTNPAHERQAKEILTTALPDVSISLSHELAREWREYERASTAVMNSYIAPIVQRYLKSLEGNLSDAGLSIPVHIMQSNGGVTRAETAREQPIHTLLSGPVGGTIGGAALAEQIGRPNLLCVDMGGTSFDMSLIVDGKPGISNEAELEGLPLLLSLVEIHTIGAGGGSVAWLEAGALRVGPHSAGADPGPACYGKGGTQPTVTDANLFLGRMGRNARLGGWMELDFDATESAIHNIAQQLGLGDVELAEGILAIINAKMSDAIRTITIQQGIDPRDYAIVAFGGAGSMHAVWLARELDIPEVIVPWSPGTFSAWGMLQTDIRRDLTANFFKQVATITNEDVSGVLERLSSEGRELLFAEKVSEADIEFEFSADMRYIGQEYFVNVPIAASVDLAVIEDAFHNAHATRYGHSTPGAPVEFVNLRVGAIGKLDTRAGAFIPGEQAGDPVIETRAIVFDGKSIDTHVLNRDAIPVGSEYKGPLVIDENSATTVIPPGYDLHIDNFGNLIIRKED
ncbi:MAG: hydantoinase/oxoprolinase family protein [Chloroflexota bacterium]